MPWYAVSARRAGLLRFVGFPGLVDEIGVDGLDVRLTQNVVESLHPVGATAPRSTMSLNIACRLGSSLRRSGVELGPSTWQREHSWMNLISPKRMRASLAVCTGGFGTGGSTRGGGVGTGGPPSLKARSG